jgi:hypothetical protein
MGNHGSPNPSSRGNMCSLRLQCGYAAQRKSCLANTPSNQLENNRPKVVHFEVTFAGTL